MAYTDVHQSKLEGLTYFTGKVTGVVMATVTASWLAMFVAESVSAFVIVDEVVYLLWCMSVESLLVESVVTF